MPRIEIMPAKKFIGMRTKMSFAENKTFELWSGFMPRHKEIKSRIGKELYSIELYAPLFFDAFNPNKIFEKWAAVETEDFDIVPEGMETFISPEGLYAVFIHRGPASEGPKTYSYIFNEWLPRSGYVPDNRPHFAVMGDKYRNDSPDSEEDLWIPVSLR